VEKRIHSSNESEEMYLKEMLALSAKGARARTSGLAGALAVAPASVTEMLAKLAKKGLVRHKAYQGAKLTQKGRREAEKVMRRYQLLERFLADCLKISKAEAARQACLMEHCVSKETEKRICQIMGHPVSGMGETPMPKCRMRGCSCEPAKGPRLLAFKDAREHRRHQKSRQ